MEWKLYIALSFAMFMEYAIWGAWMPVLAARLLGPLKMSGKQTGWIYATLPLACIIAPLIAAVLADEYFETKYIIGVAHLVGAVLLFFVANKTTFKSIFGILLLYCFLFAATLPLVNAILFANVSDAGDQGKVFLWAPVAWALVGWFLTGWRWIFKTGKEGRDCLYLAAVISVIMGIGCLIILPLDPADAPANATAVADASSDGLPLVKAMALLKDGNFLLFFVISMIIFGLMQFYFLGTARFMQDLGIPDKNIPASMGLAQVAQAIATLFALGVLVNGIGYKWTLVAGASCWVLLYIIYIATTRSWLVVRGQSLHGLAYVFFVIAGQMYANSQASDEMRSSVQGLLFAATTGVGLFLGTQFAGIVMDKCRKEDKFQWSQIFTVPADIAIICIVVLMIFFVAS